MAEDRDIIQQVLDGEIDNFSRLIEKYRQKIFGIVGKRIPSQDHNEVAQDVFLNCFRSLSNFKLDLPFENWLSRIAMRTCYDYWRKQEKHKKTVGAPEEKHEEWLEHARAAKSVEDFENQVKREETLEMLELLMQQLKPENRLLIDMIYFEGMSLQEAADVLEWKLSKVKVRAMRAREKMRDHLKQVIGTANDKKKN